MLPLHFRSSLKGSQTNLKGSPDRLVLSKETPLIEAAGSVIEATPAANETAIFSFNSTFISGQGCISFASRESMIDVHAPLFIFMYLLIPPSDASAGTTR